MSYNELFYFSLIYSNNFHNIITSLEEKFKNIIFNYVFKFSTIPSENFRLTGSGPLTTFYSL